MSKLTETQYVRNLRQYSEGKTYLNLTGLLNSRLETLKNELLTANESEVKNIQGRAKEITHLLNSLTRDALKQQHTGAFN